MNKPESKELSATKRVSARRASTESDLPAAEKTGTIAKRVHARRPSAEPLPAREEQRPDTSEATEGLALAGVAIVSEPRAGAPEAREQLALAGAAPASEPGAEAPQPSEGLTFASAEAPHASPASATRGDVGARSQGEGSSTDDEAGAVMPQPAAAAPSSVPPPRARARRPRAKQVSLAPAQAPATPPTAAGLTAQSAVAEPSAPAAPQHAPSALVGASARDSAALKHDGADPSASPPAATGASARDSAALKHDVADSSSAPAGALARDSASLKHDVADPSASPSAATGASASDDVVAVAAVASEPPLQPGEVASEPAAAVEESPAVQSESAPRESASMEAKRWSTSLQAAEEIPPPSLDHVDFSDDFGLDAQYETKLRPWLESLCERHFHVELHGAEHIPAHGRALLVANHSRASVWDGILLRAALRQHHPAGRVPRWLIDDQQFHAPFLGTIVNRLGAVRACQENAERLLLREELVAVFPEGSKATQRPYEDRYRLQRFGRGGYVKLALRTGTPVFPVAIVATEYEGAVWRNRLASASRVLSAPFAALRPGFPRIGLLGVPPISARIRIYVGASVDEISRHDASVTQDDALVHELNECVRSAVQNLVNASLHS